MRTTGVTYELVRGAEVEKQAEKESLKSHGGRRQSVFMIESIAVHARLLWNQQLFLQHTQINAGDYQN